LIWQDHQAAQVPVLVEWEGGSVLGGNDTAGGGNATGNGTEVQASGGARKLDSSAGRYNYSPLQKVNEKQNRNLQTATTLKVDFIDCVFSVRPNTSLWT